MIVIDTRCEGSQLWIRLTGEYGHDDENLRSGRAVQNALEEALERYDGEISEVVIDYSNVNNTGGDGPLWSVSSAYRKRLAVRCVASGETHEWIAHLLATTNMDRLIKLELGR